MLIRRAFRFDNPLSKEKSVAALALATCSPLIGYSTGSIALWFLGVSKPRTPQPLPWGLRFLKWGMVIHLFAHIGSTIVWLWLASWLHATSYLANSLLALGFLTSIDNSATGMRARLATTLPCPLMLACVSFLLTVGSDCHPPGSAVWGNAVFRCDLRVDCRHYRSGNVRTVRVVPRYLAPLLEGVTFCSRGEPWGSRIRE